MTTADRIDFRSWAPSVVIPDDDVYAGRHRKPGVRALALLRMFYRPRHLAR